LFTKIGYIFFTKYNGKCRCINEEPYGNENKARFIEQSVYGYSGHADPSSGDIDPLQLDIVKERDGLTILPFFS